MPQSTDLHRALLRPALLHLLRAAGFHSTKPSVLDTLTDLAERYLLLLASTTAHYAHLTHNDALPTITDVRMAMADCGALTPGLTASEEAWREIMRVPVAEMGRLVGGAGSEARVRAEKRKREEEDTREVRAWTEWVEGREYAEARRVAGMLPEGGGAGGGAVGVGGGVVQAEDFLTGLRKKLGKGGEDGSGRLVGTVLGREAEGREVLVEGGPVGRVRDWRPRVEEVVVETDGDATMAIQEAK
ncbi:hypothetical protein LTR53_001486 [Teratosphaeriaceae sp. CCFEE 6253]|nr:hypothetical protein LTR53_001486 [Teratosphaeriaceae sp. CCFEE 6253]